MKLTRRRLFAAIAVTAGVIGSLGTTATLADAAAVPTPPPATQTVGSTIVTGAPPLASAADLNHFIATTPTAIVEDASTGSLTSVSAIAIGLKAQISHRTFCGVGDADWDRQVPLVNECFYGSAGTYTGNWPSSIRFNTGSYYASGGFYNNNGRQFYTPEQAPGSYTQLSAYAIADKGTIY